MGVLRTLIESKKVVKRNLKKNTQTRKQLRSKYNLKKQKDIQIAKIMGYLCIDKVQTEYRLLRSRK